MPNKKSLPNKISLVEVSFESVLVAISPQHFWSKMNRPNLFGRGDNFFRDAMGGS